MRCRHCPHGPESHGDRVFGGCDAGIHPRSLLGYEPVRIRNDDRPNYGSQSSLCYCPGWNPDGH